MFNQRRICCVTPAGRQRYLEILVPYVLSSPLVDEYQLWNNTSDEYDSQFLYALEATSPKLRVIEPTLFPKGLLTSIGQFFAHCIDPDTIYIRFDDDIVFVEPLFFEKFLQFRLDNPQFFLVFPNIINNALCTYVQHMLGRLDPGTPVHPWCMDPTLWRSPHFAEQIHRAFLRSAAAGTIEEWYFGPRPLALSRFSINCMAWFGSDFESFDGLVPQNEESWLSVVKPAELGRTNCIYGDVVVSHFAFYTQREHLDTTDLLQQYTELAARTISTHTSAPRPHDSSCAFMSLSASDLWTPRLLSVIETLRHASLEDMASPRWIAHQVRLAGLSHDSRRLYGEDNIHSNEGRFGLYQAPMQLGRFLAQLRCYKISTVIDVGTFTGWTIAFITAYLARFNSDLRVITIDTEDQFSSYPAVGPLLPLSFHVGKTANDYAHQYFDLAIIDANHEYGACLSDYEAVGQRSGLCALHDINDKFVRSDRAMNGGVPRLWRELVTSQLLSKRVTSNEVFEFLDHPHDDQIMGIGLIARDSAGRVRQDSVWSRVIGRRSRTTGVLARNVLAAT